MDLYANVAASIVLAVHMLTHIGLARLIAMLPSKRMHSLSGVQGLCGLPHGSVKLLGLRCPEIPSGTMRVKVTPIQRQQLSVLDMYNLCVRISGETVTYPDSSSTCI
jgi:hypothetical protein